MKTLLLCKVPKMAVSSYRNKTQHIFGWTLPSPAFEWLQHAVSWIAVKLAWVSFPCLRYTHFHLLAWHKSYGMPAMLIEHERCNLPSLGILPDANDRKCTIRELKGQKPWKSQCDLQKRQPASFCNSETFKEGMPSKNDDKIGRKFLECCIRLNPGC